MTTRTTTHPGHIIIDQIGRTALIMLGAHKVGLIKDGGCDGVQFNIKIAKPGTTRARIMRVRILLTPLDLYDIQIGMLENRFDWYSLLDWKGVYADTMIDKFGQLALSA